MRQLHELTQRMRKPPAANGNDQAHRWALRLCIIRMRTQIKNMPIGSAAGLTFRSA
jgi:hypothetical protein